MTEDRTLNWTHITDPDDAISLFPAWFGSRMLGPRGSFGLLLTSGDVMRITSIVTVHQSSTGIVLLDVTLDQAGVPEGVEMAWRAAVEFVAAEFTEPSRARDVPSHDEIVEELERAGLTTNMVSQTSK